MFGCYNCSVLRSDNRREEIKETIEKKSEELRQMASQIGMTVQVSVTSK